MSVNRYQFRLRGGLAGMAMMLMATEAIGQEVRVQTTETPAGQVGQRQTRDQIAPNAEPMARINNRIQNRIQSRVQNRVDRFYNPQTSTTSPFKAANAQLQETAQPNPR